MMEIARLRTGAQAAVADETWADFFCAKGAETMSKLARGVLPQAALSGSKVIAAITGKQLLVVSVIVES
jgi:hypothetical protein